MTAAAETVKFSPSTKAEPSKDSLQTSSTTAAPSLSPFSENENESIDTSNNNNNPQIVFHTNKNNNRNNYKIGAVYWRHGFSLPENGRIKLRYDDNKFSFKGILGTKYLFDLKNVQVEKAGGLLHDSFIIRIVGGGANSREGKEGKEYQFSTAGLKDTKKFVDKIQSAIVNARLCKEEEEFDAIMHGDDDDDDDDDDDSKKKKKKNVQRVLKPDSTLQKMDCIIADKRLKGISLQDYYQVAWSEGNKSDEEPMYGPFLEKQGKNNVAVLPWESGTFEGDYCGETYTEKRIVTFSFMKQTIGHTLVEVKHTQQLRREGDDRCIVQIKMEMKGFPYADCFVVEVRHVASCIGENDLKVQIGMTVKFLKPTIFEKKIRTNTGAETTKAQLALLDMILVGCVPYAKKGDVVKKDKFRMPPDATLQKMEIIAERKLKRVGVRDYHEVAWSDKKPMYGPFLEEQGKNHVVVQPWESGTYEGDWCGETYSEKRIVRFSFMKQTIGQTLVEVKHTQQLRLIGNDQCIVQIQMEMKGFPYADCFVVEVRHVASRVGENELNIQIGMHVEFLKSCMFEKKIRKNTGAETTKAQLALLYMILKGIAPYMKETEGHAELSEDETEDEDEELENALTSDTPTTVARHQMKLPDPIINALRFVMAAFVSIFRTYVRPYAPPELFDPFPPTSVEDALLSTRANTKLLEEISLKSSPERRRKDISREMTLIAKSIDRIEKMTTKSGSP